MYPKEIDAVLSALYDCHKCFKNYVELFQVKCIMHSVKYMHNQAAQKLLLTCLDVKTFNFMIFLVCLMCYSVFVVLLR